MPWPTVLSAEGLRVGTADGTEDGETVGVCVGIEDGETEEEKRIQHHCQIILKLVSRNQVMRNTCSMVEQIPVGASDAGRVGWNVGETSAWERARRAFYNIRPNASMFALL